MCLTTFSFRSCHHNECVLPYRRHAAKRLLHLRRTRRTESYRAFLCSVWSFAQFLLQPDQRKENSFLFQVFPPVIAGKSQTHPLPDRKLFHGKWYFRSVLKYPLPEWRTDRDHGYLLPDLLDRQNSWARVGHTPQTLSDEKSDFIWRIVASGFPLSPGFYLVFIME